jgi:hypothetical protein
MDRVLERCIRRIEFKRPDRVELLQKDYDLQDILAVNLERAVQASVDVALADRDRLILAAAVPRGGASVQIGACLDPRAQTAGCFRRETPASDA